jgi:ATP-dependent DNA helicase RecG
MDLLRLLSSGGVKSPNGGVNSPSDSESGGVKMLEDELIELINNMPGLNAPALAVTLNKSLRTTQRYLKQLTSDHKIEFRGAPKIGGYYIIEK